MTFVRSTTFTPSSGRVTAGFPPSIDDGHLRRVDLGEDFVVDLAHLLRAGRNAQRLLQARHPDVVVPGLAEVGAPFDACRHAEAVVACRRLRAVQLDA